MGSCAHSVSHHSGRSRNRTRITILASGLVTVVVLLAWICWPSTSLERYIKVSAAGRTNEFGQELVIFKITNGTTDAILSWVFIEAKMSNGWWRPVEPGKAFDLKAATRIGPRQYLQTRLRAPPVEGTWRVGVLCTRALENGNNAIPKLRTILEDWGLDWVKDRLPADNPAATIYGPEMPKSMNR